MAKLRLMTGMAALLFYGDLKGGWLGNGRPQDLKEEAEQETIGTSGQERVNAILGAPKGKPELDRFVTVLTSIHKELKLAEGQNKEWILKTTHHPPDRSVPFKIVPIQEVYYHRAELTISSTKLLPQPPSVPSTADLLRDGAVELYEHKRGKWEKVVEKVEVEKLIRQKVEVGGLVSNADPEILRPGRCIDPSTLGPCPTTVDAPDDATCAAVACEYVPGLWYLGLPLGIPAFDFHSD